MPFEETRFRLFVTVAMRAIGLLDGIAMHRAPAARAVAVLGARFPPRPCTIAIGGRSLEARLVTPKRPPSHTVLILHGIGERLDYWHDAQQMLARNNIASLVFHYSGYGSSSGAITPTNLRQDTLAAYSRLRELVPTSVTPFVLGLSLGTAVAVDAAPHLQPRPSGVILCEPFSSFRSASVAVCGGLGVLGAVLRPLARIVPDLYRSAATVHRSRAPLLVVHSDADELFPVAMAREIVQAASADPDRTVELVVPHGFGHNDAYLRPSPAYWRPVLDFMMRMAKTHRKVDVSS